MRCFVLKKIYLRKGYNRNNMKYIITLFTLLIFYSATAKDTLQVKSDSVKYKINQLDKKVSSIENNLSNSLVQEYKDLNNIYAVGFGILIALFGLIFPAVLYLTQIKPAQDALKEAKTLLAKIDENFENSFKEHLRKSKEKLIDQAIESFENHDDQNFQTSRLFLQNNKSESFTKSQIIRLLSLIKREDIDDDEKYRFCKILAYQKLEQIEDYFVDLIITDPKNNNSYSALTYLAKNNKTEYFEIITNVLLQPTYTSFDGMFNTFFSLSKSFAYNILNYEKLVEELKDNHIISLCREIELNNTKKYNKQKIKESLMWKKYLEIKEVS